MVCPAARGTRVPVNRGPIREEFLGPSPPAQFLAAPSWPKDREQVYRRVLDVLDDAGVAYLVGGGLAVNAHTGIWRESKDVDVFMEEHEVDRALDALEDAGLGVETVYREWLSRTFDGQVFVDVIHHNANGLVPVGADWFDRASVVDVLGRHRAVVGPEDLVGSKIYVVARNRCDVVDIVHVLRAKGAGLDWDLLADLAGDDAAGLLLAHLHLFRWIYPADAALVPDALLRRLEAAARATPASFRGTLLDAVSFRVDVDGWGLPDVKARVVDEVLDGMSPEGPTKVLE